MPHFQWCGPHSACTVHVSILGLVCKSSSSSKTALCVFTQDTGYPTVAPGYEKKILSRVFSGRREIATVTLLKGVDSG